MAVRSISGWPPRDCQLHVGRDAVLFITVTLHPPSRIPSTQEVLSDIDRGHEVSPVWVASSLALVLLYKFMDLFPGHDSVSSWMGRPRDNSPRNSSSLEELNSEESTKNSSLGHWGLAGPTSSHLQELLELRVTPTYPSLGGTAARVCCPWSPRSHTEAVPPAHTSLWFLPSAESGRCQCAFPASRLSSW